MRPTRYVIDSHPASENGRLRTSTRRGLTTEFAKVVMPYPKAEYVQMLSRDAPEGPSVDVPVAPAGAWWFRFLGLILALLGSTVLVGWLFDLPLLKSIRPGWVSMQATTALSFVLSGIAIWQAPVEGQPSTRWAFPVSHLCASVAALIGLLKLAEFVAGWQFGIDNLIVERFSGHGEISYRAIGANTASAVLFGNAALLLLGNAEDRRSHLAAAGSLAILTLLLGLFGASKYVDGITVVSMSKPLVGMSLHSALASILLGSAGLGIAWIRGGWRWSFAAPIVVASTFVLLVLIGVGLESFRSTRAFVANSRQISVAQDVQLVVSQLNAGLAIARSGVSDFVMSAREGSLQRYTAGRRQILESRLRLGGLTTGSSEQRARMTSLLARLDRQLDLLKTAVEVARAGDAERAVHLLVSDDGQAQLDAIYSLSLEMDNYETQLLAQRNAQSALLVERTLLILPTGTLLGLGLFLGVLLHLNTGAIERRDITAAVATSEARFRSLVLATSQIVWTTDANGQVQGPQPSWQAYTGQSDGEILGSGWANALHPDDLERGCAGWIEAVSTRSLFETEYRIRRHDGVYRDFYARGAAVPNLDGSVREWIRTCTDITDRRRAKIEHDRSELEHRVVERTEQLEAANQELEAFTYSVSHDLRAPLRGVDSFSRMIIEDYGSTLDAEGVRMLNVVRSESQRMGNLIDDLLAFSRVGRVEIRLQSIDMTALVRGVIDNLGLPPERRLDIELKPLPGARGDRNLIEQVWVNLLSNAVKFTNHESRPSILVGASAADGIDTYFVKDNGAGFDPRYAHKLFGVFQRLHTEEEFEGTGVGLALVQRIVSRHGGKVRAEGEIGKGASFYFFLGTATSKS